MPAHAVALHGQFDKMHVDAKEQLPENRTEKATGQGTRVGCATSTRDIMRK